ncbi:hypothetical protein BGX26_009513 [Mortierella sp. AD094]|nr:hypothetical protein BGX26_009513 [Mortierella sp. AD094]
MKWDHESESDVMMVVSEDNRAMIMKEPVDLKQPAVAIPSASATDNVPEKLDNPYENELEMIEGEVSHMVVEARESRGATPPPLCSSPPESASASSPCSSTSSHDEPLTPTAPMSSLFSSALGGGVHKPSDLQATPSASQNDRNSYNRSGPWSFSSTSSSSSSYTTYSSVPTSSLIRSDESVYAAVPISHELYIIPKSSRGFHWNGDLFLKPHQRRSLGVDHIFNMADQQQYHQMYNESGNGFDGSSHGNGLQQNQHRHNQDSSVVMVHEIRLDDQETAGILPSWP